jgi:hypothetical protein
VLDLMFKKFLTIVLLVTGVLALAYASYVVMDAYQRQPRIFEPARMQPPVVSRPIDGEAIGKIQIPRLGVAVVSITMPERPPTIRQDVARPAADFTTYVEGETSVKQPRKLGGVARLYQGDDRTRPRQRIPACLAERTPGHG